MDVRLPLLALAFVLALSLSEHVTGQQAHDGVLKLGGFRCIDLRPLRNDGYLDLYRTGYWSYASFRMDVWKRMGVPFWQPQGAGNIRVAGPEWRPPSNDAIPGTAHAGRALPAARGAVGTRLGTRGRAEPRRGHLL